MQEGNSSRNEYRTMLMSERGRKAKRSQRTPLIPYSYIPRPVWVGVVVVPWARLSRRVFFGPARPPLCGLVLA